MKPARIALYGHFGSGNVGNDSSLEAALENMRELLPSAQFTCICNGPEAVRKRFNIEAVDIEDLDIRAKKRLVRSKWAKLKWIVALIRSEGRSWLKRAQCLRDVDLFVVVGTGAVDDMAVRGPWDAPFALYKWCKSAKGTGAAVAFLSVGVGPIVHPLSRRLMLRALRLADSRSYRETAAVEYLHRYGFDTRGDAVTPDLVFSLRPRKLAACSDALTPRNAVGLGLISYFGWRNDHEAGEEIYQVYMAKMKRFAHYLVEHGYTIRILVGDATDKRPVDEMMSYLEAAFPLSLGEVVKAEAIGDVDDLLGQIAQVQVVVASRFHNVLCSLMEGRPVVSIGYHEKNELLLSGTGLRDYCQNIETFEYERLVEQFRLCFERRELIAQQIHRHLDDYRTQLDDQYRLLLARFGCS